MRSYFKLSCFGMLLLRQIWGEEPYFLAGYGAKKCYFLALLITAVWPLPLLNWREETA